VAPERDPGEQHERYRVDESFYNQVRDAHSKYRVVDKFIVPPLSGKGFTVKAGQLFRIIEVEGPQVVDVAFWNAGNPGEFFDADRTFQLEGWFVKRYSRLWSQSPWFRPIATCTEDTVITQDADKGYHHHWMGSHCAPEIYELRAGLTGLNACHLNLLEAIEPFGLTEGNILHNLNVHTKARVDPMTGRIYCTTSDAKQGDYIEFYAEIDLLVGVSVCPNGDGLNDGTKPQETGVRPVGVEIYETGIVPKPFPKWTDWRPTWVGKWRGPSR